MNCLKSILPLQKLAGLLSLILFFNVPAFAQCPYGGAPVWLTTSKTVLNSPFSWLEVEERDQVCLLFGLPYLVLQSDYTIRDKTNNCATIASGTASFYAQLTNTYGFCPAGQILSIMNFQGLGFRGECIIPVLFPIATGNMVYLAGSLVLTGSTAAPPAC